MQCYGSSSDLLFALLLLQTRHQARQALALVAVRAADARSLFENAGGGQQGGNGSSARAILSGKGCNQGSTARKPQLTPSEVTGRVQKVRSLPRYPFQAAKGVASRSASCMQFAGQQPLASQAETPGRLLLDKTAMKLTVQGLDASKNKSS